MIIATDSGSGRITTEITVKSEIADVLITVASFTTASMPAFQIKTEEAQLRGPPGPASASELPTDPLAYYILAKG